MPEEVKAEEPKAEPVKRGRKPIESGPKVYAAMEIVCDAKDREKVAEQEYAQNQQPNGTLLLVNEQCGGSLLIPDFSKFPLVNRQCTCGKPGHFMVKYSVK